MHRRGALFAGFGDRHFLTLASWPSLIVMLVVTAVPFTAAVRP